MTTRTSRLRIRILACLLAAWPVFASAQAPRGQAATDAAGAPAATRSIPDEAFRQWLREDNHLIDGILRSLAHIDSLVTEVQRLLVALPDAAQARAPGAETPAPQAAPQTPMADELRASPGGWTAQIAGAALLALLAFWLGRRQVSAQAEQRQPAAKVAAPSASPEPAAALAEKRASPPPVASPPVARIPPPSSTDPGDQALELAEIMLSMGLGRGATKALTEQIRSEPKQALRHWLKLLDIYRKSGQQEEFERSSEELRQHFNVRSEDWQAQPGDRQNLEDYPHIAHRLTELWGKTDCLVYMRNLLEDNRGGARSGFPQSVAEELLLLTALMRDVFDLPPDS